jgi:hypothetical protein
MFERLIHCDWSKDPRKRWMASAERSGNGWVVDHLERVPDVPAFLDRWLFAGHRVLAGFDFPIGLPESFGRRLGKRMGCGSFLEALPELGHGEWRDFFCVAEHPGDISIQRPFYPAGPAQGSRRRHLLQALDYEHFDELLRACERGTSSRRAACSLFWTLGGNQVGKAAIDGWRSVVQPSVRRSAKLWPFAGSLKELARSAQTAICETYPGQAYRHVGVSFGRRQSKRRQADRRLGSAALLCFATAQGVTIADDARNLVTDGFGPSKAGEDPFDAFVGLLAMVSVVEGKRHEGEPTDRVWEGWILGQQPS